MRYFAALTLALGLAVAAFAPMGSAQSVRLSASNRVLAAYWVRDNGIWQLRAPDHDGH
jgi:hypothetical protein